MRPVCFFVPRAMILTALPALLLAAACGDDVPNNFPNQPGGNPLVPEIALLPYPSDYYLEEDATTATGRSLHLPQEALPANMPAELFPSADGFSMAPHIIAWLPGGIDAAGLPELEDPEATTRDDSPVFVVRVSDNERVPLLVEMDANTDDVAMQTLIMRAHRKLAADEAFVVILRNTLRTLDGQEHVPSKAFLALRDGTRTGDADVERQRASFDTLVNPTIAAQGLEPSEVVLAWSFHTRSEENVVHPLVDMQQMVWAADVGDYTILEDGLDEDQEYRQIDGVFEAPSFRTNDGFIEYDQDGLPILQGYEDADFMLIVPVSVDETRPVIVYGHGFFSSYDEVTYGGVNKLCRERRYSAVGTNYGFNLSESGEQFMIMTDRLDLWPRLVALHLQRIVNFTALAKLTKEKLAVDITSDGPLGAFHPLDASDIQYAGISNGGTFGYVQAATSPAFERATLIVGGGGLTHFLQRAVNWFDYMPFFEGTWDDPLTMQMVLALMQGRLDPIDSINFAHRLTENRFSWLPPMRASVHMAVNDSQVRNVLTEWIARTANIPLVTPSAKSIWGLDTITASSPDGAVGVDSVLHVYDEQLEAPPEGNIPPETDNGTHSSVPRSAVMQEHWYQFVEYGKFVQTCTDECDPD